MSASSQGTTQHPMSLHLHMLLLPHFRQHFVNLGVLIYMIATL